MPRIILFLLLLSATFSVRAQGIELQAYPAGLIGVGSWDVSLDYPVEFRVHAGFNGTRRQDWGEHDDERGSGPGFGADATWMLDRIAPFWIGVRADYWFLDIDWEDPGAANPGSIRSGSTSVQVFQPTVRFGWRKALSGVQIDVSTALGAEINVQIEGEAVGKGAILLVGLRVSR